MCIQISSSLLWRCVYIESRLLATCSQPTYWIRWDLVPSRGPGLRAVTVAGLICGVDTAMVLSGGVFDLLPHLLHGHVHGHVGLLFLGERGEVVRIMGRLVRLASRLGYWCGGDGGIGGAGAKR